MPEPIHLVAADLITDRALTLSDRDRLESHRPIAARVAELITHLDPPVNMALLGAWGSGKSSFAQLLERDLPAQPLRTRLVTYDAWTFADESFQRNFISQAAAKLEFARESDEGRPFHEGLYQSKRNAKVSLTPAQVWRASRTFLGVMTVIGLALLAFTSWVVLVLAGMDDPVGTVIATLPSWITAAGVLGLIGAFTKEVLDSAWRSRWSNQLQLRNSSETRFAISLRPRRRSTRFRA